MSGTRWSPCAGTTTDSAKAPSTWVPIDRRSGHTFGRPARHWRQCPQVEKYVSLTTRAPSQPGSTPEPLSTTVPQTSWPIVTGGTLGYSPASMCRSVPQIPAARTASRTAWAGSSAGVRSSRPMWPRPGASLATPSICLDRLYQSVTSAASSSASAGGATSSPAAAGGAGGSSRTASPARAQISAPAATSQWWTPRS